MQWKPNKAFGTPSLLAAIVQFWCVWSVNTNLPKRRACVGTAWCKVIAATGVTARPAWSQKISLIKNGLAVLGTGLQRCSCQPSLSENCDCFRWNLHTVESNATWLWIRKKTAVACLKQSATIRETSIWLYSSRFEPLKAKAKAKLRPTVSRPVSLGVKPRLWPATVRTSRFCRCGARSNLSPDTAGSNWGIQPFLVERFQIG
jgi:hypothetical protein